MFVDGPESVSQSFENNDATIIADIEKFIDENQEKLWTASESVEEACNKKELTEDEEIEIVDDEAAVEEIPAEEPVAEDEPRQVICECDKCGALVIKDEADVVVDEETDLVNVEEECKFCEEAKGFKIVGSVVPYEAAEEAPIEEAFETFKKPIAWSKLKGTHTLQVVEFKNIKKGDLVFTDVTLPDKVADDDIAYWIAKVVLNGSDVSLKLGGAQGSVDADATDKCYKAVPNDGENISEDLADWYRKTFDKPARISTQQAWEDELNGFMGEISDKRRAHLERKFQQQRDWEERHPDKEVKY
jgi:hypothetical protein